MKVVFIRPESAFRGVDFARIESQLIAPALARLSYAINHTIALPDTANPPISEFQSILAADLVIVDFSRFNAAVLHQLGIREALRNRRSFFVRAAGVECDGAEVRCDFAYDPDDPARCVDALADALRNALIAPDKIYPDLRATPEATAQANTEPCEE